jgi:predicted nucleic acid-binding protein
MTGNEIVLDTNIVLYLLAGDETLSVFLQDKEVYLSIICELELIGFPDISPKELKEVKGFLAECTVIDINEEIKSTYTLLCQQYRLKLGDAAAAATAIYLNLPFISADKGFNKVKELQLTLYYAEQ